tara:strand:+ start:4164 stop:5630 length:1467 start_codon:yes stop_codon:yes gene_type:complete
MSDILNVTGSNYTAEPAEQYGPDVNTGALRRKYNFGDKVSELSLAQDPFFRFVSMVSKKPTDDPTFKFTEKRESYTKRYVYINKHDNNTGTANVANSTAINASADAAGDSISLEVGTDWMSNGNRRKAYGQTADGIGDSGTEPEFLFPGQLLKLPITTANNASHDQSVSDYLVVKIDTVKAGITSNYKIVDCKVVKGESTAATTYFMGAPSAALLAGSNEGLEPYRCYVVGTAFSKGSGYPETWNDQPYSTATGQTQIFKTSCVMDNTDRATVLKYEGNEWARIWKQKLIEHKWDIENALLFGQQNATYNTTQGAVDWISQYGNAFSLDIATKSQDDFLDDMSAMLDPRYNNSASTVFFCNTAVYNWLHKLSGYFRNNVESSANYRADFSLAGKKKVFGIDITTISTVYGDMNIARNVHLDGTNVKILGINMKYCAYRPLVGNGINRDTGIYVGVQTLENSGVDRRVDQILTEAGMEWCCPETHALWT